MKPRHRLGQPKNRRKPGAGAPHSADPRVGAYSPDDVMLMLNITRDKFNAMIRHGDLATIRVRGVIRVSVSAFRKAFPTY